MRIWAVRFNCRRVRRVSKGQRSAPASACLTTIAAFTHDSALGAVTDTAGASIGLHQHPLTPDQPGSRLPGRNIRGVIDGTKDGGAGAAGIPAVAARTTLIADRAVDGSATAPARSAIRRGGYAAARLILTVHRLHLIGENDLATAAEFRAGCAAVTSVAAGPAKTATSTERATGAAALTAIGVSLHRKDLA
jgi:hypothetical protein